MQTVIEMLTSVDCKEMFNSVKGCLRDCTMFFFDTPGRKVMCVNFLNISGLCFHVPILDV